MALTSRAFPTKSTPSAISSAHGSCAVVADINSMSMSPSASLIDSKTSPIFPTNRLAMPLPSTTTPLATRRRRNRGDMLVLDGWGGEKRRGGGVDSQLLTHSVVGETRPVLA